MLDGQAFFTEITAETERCKGALTCELCASAKRVQLVGSSGGVVRGECEATRWARSQPPDADNNERESAEDGERGGGRYACRGAICMTDRWSTKCAPRARASPLYTLELAPVLAQIGPLSSVRSFPSSAGPAMPTPRVPMMHPGGY
jgi:hypothetical protein